MNQCRKYSKAEVAVIWIAVVLMILSLLYPPYGYSRFTISHFKKKEGVIIVKKGSIKLDSPSSYQAPSLDDIPDRHYSVPWTYVRHDFILSAPLNHDRILYEKYRNLETDKYVMLAQPDDYRIAWNIVFIQIFIIGLLAFGSVFTLRRLQRAPP
jgi:hypothetical protein